MRMKRHFVALALLASLSSQTACYDWVPVDPVDAQKLSGSFAVPAGPHTVAIRVVDVRQPDGRVAELEGDLDVRLELRNGARYDFEHPVLVTDNGVSLEFRGGNRGAVTVRREDIASLEASKLNRGQTIALGASLGVALGLIAGGIAIAAVNK